MLKYAEQIVERKKLEARPQLDVDRRELRAQISERFSASLAYLGR